MWDSLLGLQVANYDLWRVVVFFLVVLLSMAIGRLARMAMRRAGNRAGNAGKKWLAVPIPPWKAD